MSREREERVLFVGARAAAIAGGVVGLVVVGAQLLVGAVSSGAEARQPVAVIILALILTRLSLARALERDPGPAFSRRVARSALVAIVDMVPATALLLLFGMPIREAGERAERSGAPPVARPTPWWPGCSLASSCCATTRSRR